MLEKSHLTSSATGMASVRLAQLFEEYDAVEGLAISEEEKTTRRALNLSERSALLAGFSFASIKKIDRLAHDHRKRTWRNQDGGIRRDLLERFHAHYRRPFRGF
ncbi:hypothetical protein K2P56_04590 [Patescibacteria group bacterium]|nr:hypothetical protein [Patescibacteria group bacterium]